VKNPIGNVPDILKMIDDAAAKARYGSGEKLTWTCENGGMSGADVESMLVKYGVRVYGRQYAEEEGDEYGVTVRSEQAKWAEFLMKRRGLSLTSPLIDESNANVQRGAMPKEWGVPVQRVGLAGRVQDIIESEVGSLDPRDIIGKL